MTEIWRRKEKVEAAQIEGDGLQPGKLDRCLDRDDDCTTNWYTRHEKPWPAVALAK